MSIRMHHLDVCFQQLQLFLSHQNSYSSFTRPSKRMSTFNKYTYKSLVTSQTRLQGRQWRKFPLQQYRQLYHQLLLLNNISYHHYSPGPTSDIVTISIIPKSQVLWQHHNLLNSRHLGAEKTLSHLSQETYWAGMSSDIEKYCRECAVCQCCKLPTPQKAPMSSIPIGQPWEMIVVDVLEVLVSYQNNNIQDYFTKWGRQS